MSTPQPRYQIIVNNSPDQLAADVSHWLTQGWKLQGELQVIVIPPTSENPAVVIIYVRELVR